MRYWLFDEADQIRIEWCGMAIVPTGWKHQRRSMETSVVILGDQGHFDLEEDAAEITVGPGQACILAAGNLHQGARPCQEPVRYFWLHFQSARPPSPIGEGEAAQILSDPAIARHRLANSLLLPQSWTPPVGHGLRALFQRLVAIQETPAFTPLIFQHEGRLLLLNATQHVVNQFLPEIVGETTSLVSRMIQHIHEHLSDRNFSVKVLASRLDYHPDYLNRQFQAVMHQRLKEYIVNGRVLVATKLLRDSSDSILVVSERSGFGSYRNFVYQFELRQGMKPREYRRRYLLMTITN